MSIKNNRLVRGRAMYIGVAILTDSKVHNIARDITFNLNKKYNTGIESALLPQHISLKQSFPYEGDVYKLEEFLEKFCSTIKPFKIFVERVEINSFDEESILAWLKIRKSNELKNIHMKLCREISSKFGIEPLGFDGEQWEFHSTLAFSKVKECYKSDLICEYDAKDISIEFEAKEIIMFCCMGDGSKASEYFSLKIFDMNKV